MKVSEMLFNLRFAALACSIKSDMWGTDIHSGHPHLLLEGRKVWNPYANIAQCFEIETKAGLLVDCTEGEVRGSYGDKVYSESFTPGDHEARALASFNVAAKMGQAIAEAGSKRKEAK